MDFLQPINLTLATRTLTKDDAGAIINVNRAAGSTITLPAALGTGRWYRIFVGTTITSTNLVVQVANSTDIMSGVAINTQDAGDTTIGFETAAADDTITMNGSTKGGIKGDWIELDDVAAGIWHVKVIGSATGTEVTPFSSAV